MSQKQGFLSGDLVYYTGPLTPKIVGKTSNFASFFFFINLYIKEVKPVLQE